MYDSCMSVTASDDELSNCKQITPQCTKSLNASPLCVLFSFNLSPVHHKETSLLHLKLKFFLMQNILSSTLYMWAATFVNFAFKLNDLFSSFQGDSGGPLQCKQGSVWIQAGISSFGIPCALAGFPEVFTRVSQYQTWITNQVVGANVSFVLYNPSGTNQDVNFTCRSANVTASQGFTTPGVTAQLVIITVLVTLLQILAL